MCKRYFAHTSSHGNEDLIDHLQLTGRLARANGRFFSQEEVCEQLGLLHDVGKHTQHFQQVLQGLLQKQDHAIVASMLYADKVKPICDTLKKKSVRWLAQHMSLIMAAHHSYLYTNERTLDSVLTSNRIADKFGRVTMDKSKEIAVKDMAEYQEVQDYVTQHHLFAGLKPEWLLPWASMSMCEQMLYVRFLYSALVDADYSATHEFVEPGYLDKYFYSNVFDVDVYLDKLNQFHDKLVSQAQPSLMNDLRNEVYDVCSQKGALPKNFFTLTAPTGTGKTLALIKFALEHAKANGQRRIFIVLPYLSIIDQNAGIYQDIFGEDVVLVDSSDTEYTEHARYLVERWASPIVVTTSVKFFQTLFTCKATEVRRLHSLSDSMIVFDECQTLPSGVLNSAMESLQSLVKYYKCSVLLSTATLPAYQYRTLKENFYKNTKSLKCKKKYTVHFQWNPVELMDDVKGVFQKYEKVKSTVIQSMSDVTSMTCDDLIHFYEQENQVIYIFNTIAHAETMYDAVVNKYGDDGCYLLTSRFCVADKRAFIEKINARLQQGLFTRLIATQCVEAGVDFDFPAGAREYAPLDSIIQACGRVNRSGKVINAPFLVFQYEKHGRFDYPSVSYKEASDISKRLFETKVDLNIYSQEDMDNYFRELYQSSNYSHDREELLDAYSQDDYEMVSKYARLIEENHQTIYVVKPVFADDEPWYHLMQELEANNFVITRYLLKKLQPYTVALYHGDAMGNQLSVRVKQGQQALLNWYVLDSGYDESGLHLNKMQDTCVF